MLFVEYAVELASLSPLLAESGIMTGEAVSVSARMMSQAVRDGHAESIRRAITK